MTIDQFADVVELTSRKYIRSNYVNLLTDKQDHPAAKELIKKSMMSREGTNAQAEGIYWKARMRTAASYRHIAATTPDQVNITQDYVGMSAPWRKVEVKYAFLEDEIDFNMGEEQIVDLVKEREKGIDFDFIEGIDADYWTPPSATDALAFRSLPYWCPKTGATTTGGFDGTVLSGFSDKGGLSPTTWPRLKNYCFLYTDVTLGDLISKLRDMFDLTYFKPPIPGVADLGKPSGPAKALYTTLSVRKQFADVADSRNDNLGPDVATMDGKVTFRGAEMVWVPELDRDTTNPIYQIDFSTFRMIPKPGWWQVKQIIKPWPGQRNQIAVFKTSYLAFLCFSPRTLGVGATGTTYPS